MNHRTLRWLLVTALTTACLTDGACGQEAPVNNAPTIIAPQVRWSWFDPTTAISSRIYAQAELLRAGGEASVNLATARKIHAEAVDKELDNWVKQVRAYWERKLVREQNMLDLERFKQIRKDRYLNNEKQRNKRTWDRIMNHPELTGAGIEQGAALNFLLHRLSGTALAYRFQPEGEEGDSLEDKLRDVSRLPDHVVNSLNLRQLGYRGDQLVFRLNQTAGLDIHQWPYLLRDSAFAADTNQLERARKAAVEQSDTAGTISFENLRKVEQAVMTLTQSFYRKYTADYLMREGSKRFFQYRSAEAFLRDLDREVARLQNTGEARALVGTPGMTAAKDCDNLIGLLTYMSRNGLEFAPCTPGEEAAYRNVFAMMRDLYLTVATSDTSIARSELVPAP